MATDILSVVTTISQIVADAYDGTHDERFASDGKAKKIGLRREEGDPIIDSRVIDGFKVRFGGNIMYLSYQSPVKLSDFHENTFKEEAISYIKNILKYIKKEYKKLADNSLTLKEIGEPHILVQSTTRVRAWVEVLSAYEIRGTDYEGVEEKEAGAGRLKDFMNVWDTFNKGTTK